MRINSITVSRALTINLGNYESAKIGGEVVVELDEGDAEQDAWNMGSTFLDDQLASELEALDPSES